MVPLALFDLDGTLVDRADAFARWADAFARTRRLGGPDTVAWLIKTDDDGFLPKDEFFTRVRDRFGLTDTTADLQHEYAHSYPQHMTCAPAVLDALTRLRRAGWRTGVVTNGQSAVQQAVLDHTGLTTVLDGWCISETEGIRKPDPEIFRRTAHRCGTDLTRAVMTGDSPDADITGAHRAGLRTVWIRRGRTWPDSLPLPDHTTDTITEAIDLLL